MKVLRRNLFVTLRMLRTGGIDADIAMVSDRVRLFLKHPEPGRRPLAASFKEDELEQGAQWLAACVVHYYPKSDLAKVWRVVLEAAGVLPAGSAHGKTGRS
jgi:hypothetical protein